MRLLSLFAFLPLIGTLHAAQGTDEFTSLGCPPTTKAHPSLSQLKDAFTDYVDLLYNQKQLETAFNKYIADGYINHVPNVPKNGRDETIAYLNVTTAKVSPEVQRAYLAWAEDGTVYGTIHTKVLGGEYGKVVVDILRLVGTCFVEHWDAKQDMLPSDNPIAYF